MSAPELPLSGLKVVEFTHMVMGPVVGLLLADMGAEVIKVEPPGGDNTPNVFIQFPSTPKPRWCRCAC